MLVMMLHCSCFDPCQLANALFLSLLLATGPCHVILYMSYRIVSYRIEEVKYVKSKRAPDAHLVCVVRWRMQDEDFTFIFKIKYVQHVYKMPFTSHQIFSSCALVVLDALHRISMVE